MSRDGSDEKLGTVSRAVRVLAELADSDGEMRVNQFAEALSLPASTVHRLLRLLASEGMVAWNPATHRYGIGPALYRMSARVVDSVSLASLAQPFIESLAARFDETVLLGVYLPREKALAFAARADGDQELLYKIEMNRPLSLVWGASGRAILAFLPEPAVNAVLAHEGPSPTDGRPIPQRDDLDAQLAGIREAGYVISEGQKLQGARGVAAPVFGPGGVIGCIILTFPKMRQPHGQEEVIVEGVVQTAADLSDCLASRVNATRHPSEESA